MIYSAILFFFRSLLIVFSCYISNVSAGIIVIANKSLNIQSVSSDLLRKLYSDIPVSIHGHNIVPIDLNLNNKIAKNFYKNILDLNIYDLSRARSSVVFTGGSTHVLSVSTVKEAISLVNNNINYMAYISDDTPLPFNINVIFNDIQEISNRKRVDNYIHLRNQSIGDDKSTHFTHNKVEQGLLNECQHGCSPAKLNKLSSLLIHN